MQSRRVFLGSLGCFAVGCASSRHKPASSQDGQDPAVREIEARVGGRVGLFAVATDSGRVVAHRADERFALCSTFKWVLAAAVLSEVDRKRLALDQSIALGPADIVDHSPVTGDYVQQGRMSVEEMARAAVVSSDNTAANLLLARVGGPAGLTAFLRVHGDEVTRLDRNEPALNSNLAADVRDTTSPRAMVGTLRTLLTTDALSAENRERLIAWMGACKSGKDRLRSGLPSDWRAADKTGSGDRGAANDVAIAWPPNRGPVLVAAYLSDSAAPFAALNSAHAELGRLVAQRLQ
jgi:beta-lactamase class A